jgi:hypothetical protein
MEEKTYYTDNEIMGYSGFDEPHPPAVPATRTGYSSTEAEKTFRQQLADMAAEDRRIRALND